MGRPLSAAERQAIAAWLSCHNPTICPPCRRGTLPHLRAGSVAEAMQSLWRAMAAKSERNRRLQRQREARRPDGRVQGWYALYRTGLSLTAVGRLVGRDPSHIRKQFLEHGLACRPRGHHNSARAEARRAA